MSDNPKIRRRLRCPNCGSLDAIKWGVRNGIQRYKWRNCQTLFSARRKEISKSNMLILFKKWILGKMDVEDPIVLHLSAKLSISPDISPKLMCAPFVGRFNFRYWFCGRGTQQAEQPRAELRSLLRTAGWRICQRWCLATRYLTCFN